jgi:hypothetical protein
MSLIFENQFYLINNYAHQKCIFMAFFTLNLTGFYRL